MTAAFSERLVGDFDDRAYSPAADYFDILETGTPAVIGAAEHPDIEYMRACGNLTNPLPKHESTVGAYWFYAGIPDTWYSHLLRPNDSIPDCGDVGFGMFNSGIITARSAHLGGVNCVFMDGHVRYIANQVDVGVWQAAGTRDGREGVSADW